VAAGQDLKFDTEEDVTSFAYWVWRNQSHERPRLRLDRAKDLLREGKLFGAQRVGSTLSATCLGTTGAAYSMAAEFESHAQPDDWVTVCCSCPAGREPVCKHALALLLHHVAEPGLRPAAAAAAAGGGGGAGEQTPGMGTLADATALLPDWPRPPAPSGCRAGGRACLSRGW
jgi:hypothetical protein